MSHFVSWQLIGYFTNNKKFSLVELKETEELSSIKLTTEADTIRRMRFTTQWRTAFRVKSFKAVVIRGKLPGEKEGDGGGGRGGGAVGD